MTHQATWPASRAGLVEEGMGEAAAAGVTATAAWEGGVARAAG